MAEIRVEKSCAESNLFVPVSDIMLAEVIDTARVLACRYPGILERIESDQDHLALQKKQLWRKQQAWVRSRTGTLPGFETFASARIVAGALQGGRPRMDSETALVFLVISQYFNAIYSDTAVERLLDSLSVYRLLAVKGIRMPVRRTIGDNANAVSLETPQYILQSQARVAVVDELDDFREVFGDSTSCAANTRWPTDSGLILRLLRRTFRNSQKLDEFGLPNVRVHWTRQWLTRLRKLDFALSNAKNRCERRNLYRRFLKTASKTAWHLGDEVFRLHRMVPAADLPAMLRQRLQRLCKGMIEDLSDLCRIHRRCENRVLDGRRAKGSGRILSLSDRTAAYISKGDRCPVVGYKPQLTRSRSGLVTALVVPEGNAADSRMLVPLVEETMETTGVVPAVASFDDGYSSAQGLNDPHRLGIPDVSFSGSKGKAALGDERWGSELLRDARRRSAVESTIFSLKLCREFGRLRRRGIKAVREELTAKVVVYNFCRIILLRKRKRAEDQQIAVA